MFPCFATSLYGNLRVHSACRTRIVDKTSLLLQRSLQFKLNDSSSNRVRIAHAGVLLVTALREHGQYIAEHYNTSTTRNRNQALYTCNFVHS